MTRPPALDGIRVLDLSRILAGPWCTQNLADLGADVIKIERPGVGDDTRAWGPPFLKDGNGVDTNESAYYLSANRNKRSVEADMATPQGEPERRCELRIPPQAALLYRLNADRNPLHADPEVAHQAGYPRPILHGLCSYGVAAHALVKTWCDYDASRLTRLDARFSAPVYPGETLQCDMWRMPDGQIRFIARAVERDIIVMSHGAAEVQS